MRAPISIGFHSENGPAIGGSDLYMGKLIDGLDRQRFEPYLFVCEDYPVEKVVRNPERVVLVPAYPARGKRCVSSTDCEAVGAPVQSQLGRARKRPSASPIWRSMPSPIRHATGLARDALRVRRLIRSAGIQIFHLMDGGPQPSAVGAAGPSCKVISAYCAPPPTSRTDWISTRLSRAAYRASSICIAKSQFAASAWANAIGVSGDKFEIIPNGHDYPAVTPADRLILRGELAVPSDAIVIGMTGRITKEKGAHVFVEAIPRILEQVPNVFFIVMGEGEERASLEDRTRKQGTADRVRFLGFRGDAYRVASIYDVAIVPSVFQEPFGWVVLEAMAQACPVIASRTGGLPEIVEDGVDGLLIQPGSVADLVQAVTGLSNSPEVRQRMGAMGQRKQRFRFSSAAMLQPTFRLYESLAAQVTEECGCARRVHAHA